MTNKSPIGWDWREGYVKGADITKEQEEQMKAREPFEIFWANFDPNHRYDEEAKNFVWKIWLIVCRANWETRDV